MTDHSTVPIHPAAGLGHGGAMRRAIGRSPRLRAVVKSAPVQHQIMTWRAVGILRGRPRFLARQLAGRGIGRYRLRQSGRTVHVRHRTGDVLILNKIFARDPAASGYVPPDAVAAMLDRAAAPRILDVGANIGLFGVLALERWPQATITAFEPDPDNLRVLRRTVAAGGVGDRWTVVDRAAGTAPGELRFVPGHGAKAHAATAGEDGTIGVPVVDLYDYEGDGVDLIKMDIEGGEWEILADPRLATLKASVLRLEWHTLLCPAPDARAEAIRLLRAGGFAHVVDGSHEHGNNGVLWAWREPAAAGA
jgi:FkbM family methyltransferase